MPSERTPPRRGDGSRGRIAALLLVGVLAVGLFLIGQAIVAHNAMQNCIDAGRRDCETRVQNP